MLKVYDACSILVADVEPGRRTEMTAIISHGAPLGAARDSVYSSTQVKLEAGDVRLRSASRSRSGGDEQH